MPLAGELQLTMFDHTDASLRGDDYRRAMTGLEGHEGKVLGGESVSNLLRKKLIGCQLRLR